MPSPTSQVPSVAIEDGVSIPQLGFGVWQVPAERAEEVVGHALGVGYRHVDTAAAYGNEAEVGRAVRAAALDRSDVFITTKLWNGDHGRDKARRALETSLRNLGVDHVDLYLIHWPVPSRDRYVETWQALVDARAEGLIRSIGVSNFQPDHLRRIIDETGAAPSVNQVELHPLLQQRALRRVHEELGIGTEAWSPLAQSEVLEDQRLAAIAEAHGKSAGQVVIRWHLQTGNIVFPKSVTPSRIEENFDVFDFELTGDQMAAIDDMDAGRRIGPDPDTFAVA